MECKDCICFLECAYTSHYLPAGDCFKGRCENCDYYKPLDDSEIYHCSRLSEILDDGYYVIDPEEYCSFFIPKEIITGG